MAHDHDDSDGEGSGVGPTVIGSYSCFSDDEDILDGFKVEITKYTPSENPEENSFSIDIENFFSTGMSTLSLALFDLSQLKQLGEMIAEAIAGETKDAAVAEPTVNTRKFDRTSN